MSSFSNTPQAAWNEQPNIGIMNHPLWQTSRVSLRDVTGSYHVGNWIRSHSNNIFTRLNTAVKTTDQSLWEIFSYLECNINQKQRLPLHCNVSYGTNTPVSRYLKGNTSSRQAADMINGFWIFRRGHFSAEKPFRKIKPENLKYNINYLEQGSRIVTDNSRYRSATLNKVPQTCTKNKVSSNDWNRK
jgi:hypothetical protein